MAIAACLLASACVDPATGNGQLTGAAAADGFDLIELATGFDGPTQLTHHPDGRLLLAELAGGENDGTGRIVALGLDGPGDGIESETLLDGLDKPTGVAAIGDELWVMEQRRLSRAPLAAAADPTASPMTVLDSLPFNGRSETTLTVTPEGNLLYGTTGSLTRGGPNPVPGSGVLWQLDPRIGVDAGPPNPMPVSAGFKNPYAHTYGPDGRLWVTEISDGTFDGARAADELVEVTPGVDHGWPTCIGDRTPVVELGGTDEACASGPRSQALFAPGATPTSVAVAPWDPNTLVVALWVERRVVTVPAGSVGTSGGPHIATDLVTPSEDGAAFRPQHLLADGDRLLIVDFDGGRLLAVEPD